MLLRLLSYPRSFLMACLYPIFISACSLTCVLLNVLFSNRKIDAAVIRFWARGSCWMFGVKVRVHGVEKIPAGGCLFLFNHTSFFDIFCMSASLPDFRFGSKIELFKIPFFGWAMERVGVLPIDRANREEVFKIYEGARQRMANGEKFALAPEGTRQEEEKISSFKSGPFVFAIGAQALLVPVLIRGASQVLPKHAVLPNLGVWTREVKIEILDPISTTGVGIEQRQQLQNEVWKKMSFQFESFQS